MRHPTLAPNVKARSNRRTVLSVHRWLGIVAGLLWLLQAVTGVIIVFHWEEDDATIAASHRPTDAYAIGRTIARLAPARTGHHVTQVWTSAGFGDRYDIMVLDEKSATVTTVRVAGDGRPIRVTPPGRNSLINIIVLLHQSLLSGTSGRWIMGASGALLLSNLIFGAFLAWPKRGQWRKALRPPTKGGPLARYYGWHRALGLMGIAPAMLFVCAGVLSAYNDPLLAALGATPPTVPTQPGTPAIAFGDAVTIAKRQVPRAKLASVVMPTQEDATYRVYLRAPGEWRRAYGNSAVFVDAVSGRVRSVALARDESPNLYWFNAIIPTHTGEAFGLLGRILLLCTGLWLATMILIGARLWWLRR